MRKRYYIFVVSHDWDGQLRRRHIPVQWVAAFLVCAVIGAGTLFGLAGSYARMLVKVQSFNQMRSRQDALMQQLSSARHNADQFQLEVASLGSLASEVSALYNFKHSTSFRDHVRNATLPLDLNPNTAATAASDQPSDVYANALSSFQILEATALTKSLPEQRTWSPFPPIWRPDMWPVRGRITSSFGERTDPINGDGSFHPGLDIAAPLGTPVHATADGMVVYSGWMEGYGRTVILNDSHGISTLYAHMSALAVTVGQHLDRDEVVGYIGDSGRSTGPHLHYEVRVNRSPVNPYTYLRP